MNGSRSVIRTFLGRVYRGFSKLLNSAKQLVIRTSLALKVRRHKAAAVAAVCSVIRVARVASTFSKITGIDLLLCTLAILYDIASFYFLTYALDEAAERLETQHQSIAM